MKGPRAIAAVVASVLFLFLTFGGPTTSRAGEPTTYRCPWNVALSPVPGNATGGEAKLLEMQLQQLFSKSGWSVVEAPRGSAMAAELGISSEEAAALSMTGVDVVVSFAGKKEIAADGASVSFALRLEAQNPRTGQMLASAVASSPARARKPGALTRATDEAAAEAFASLNKALRDACRQAQQQGRPVRLVIRNPPGGADVKVNGILRKLCSKARIRMTGRRQVVFGCLTKLEGLELRNQLDKKLQAAFPGKKFTWTTALDDLLEAGFE